MPNCAVGLPPWQDCAHVVPSEGEPVFPAGAPVGIEMALGANKLNTLNTTNNKNKLSTIFFIKLVLNNKTNLERNSLNPKFGYYFNSGPKISTFFPLNDTL
jgi:hypothetical protein